MKKQTLLLFVLILAVVFGCKKEERVDMEPTAETFTSLQISDDFEFKTTQDVNLNIVVVDQITSLIEVYNANPNEGGDLIKKGTTGADFSYETMLRLPATTSEIFVVRYSWDGGISTETIPVTSANLEYHFASGNKSAQVVGYLVEPVTGYPDCSTTPDYDIPNNWNDDLEIDGETWRLQAGSSYEGKLEFDGNGEYLVVCGTMTLEEVDGEGVIIVSSTGTLVIEDDYKPDNGSEIINFGTVQIKDGNSWKEIELKQGRIENHGTFECKKINKFEECDFYNGANATFTVNDDDFKFKKSLATNLGTLYVEGEFYVQNNTSTFENYGTTTIGEDTDFSQGSVYNYDGTMHFKKELTIQGGENFYNACKFLVDEKFEMKKDFDNDGYIYVGDELYIEASKVLTLGDGALVQVVDKFELKGDVVGPDASNALLGYAKIEIDDETKLESQGEVSGKVDICDATGINTNNATIGAAVTYCVNGVPNTACVPGTIMPVADADADGVPDSMDEYPADPDRAFNSYYPNATDYSSLAFEDLWPSMGDYDFNDLVVNFQYQTVTNGLNEVVDLIGKFDIIALGAAHNNGFGISLDVLPSTVASVTGTQIYGNAVSIASNGVENGHTGEAVIIVCDQINTYAGGAMINTSAGVSNIDIPLITVTVNFGTPQSSIGSEPFNPFLFIDQTRGREVHLINREPTDLVNLALFGTSDDNSNPANSKYYKTINNYPFVIEVPEPLDYPTEKEDIVTVHNFFGTWAESGGNDYNDWYQDKPGYRNTSKIKNN